MQRWWDNDVFVKRRSASEDELLRMREQLIREEDETHAYESSGTRKHTFRVQAETHRLERVAITGSCPELGAWDPEKIVLMNREGNSTIWTVDVLLPLLTGSRIRYRYVITTDENYTEDNIKKNLDKPTRKSIRRWEVTSSIRKIEPITHTFQATSSFRKEYLQMSPEEIRAMRREKAGGPQVPETFGIVAGSRGVKMGWLTTETALQVEVPTKNMSFTTEKFKEVPMYTKLRAIRVFQSGLEHDDFCEDLEDGWPVIELSILNEQMRKFRRQEKFGFPVCAEETMIFHVFHDDSKTLSLIFDFYVYKKSHLKSPENFSIPMHVGFAVVHPCLLADNEGEVKTEISSIRGVTIGEIQIKYAFMRNSRPLKFRFNYSLPHHWKKIWHSDNPVYEGPILKTCAEIRDNTLAAVEESVTRGFDYVELSLQLTKDGIPIFCHSPYLVIGIQNPNEIFPMNQYQVRVDNFTLPQLHRMRILPVSPCDDFMKLKGKSYPADVKNRPFPTLMQLLNGIDRNVGFIIDINTMVPLESGEGYPRFHNFDVNDVIDKVLKTVQQSGGRRNVIFTSIHPYVCSLLRLKQFFFPVIFVHDGVLDKYARYGHDDRCTSLDKAIHYAVSLELQGIGVNANTLVKNDNASRIKQENLVVFTSEISTGERERPLQACLTNSKCNAILCTRSDEYGPIRRTHGYIFEPKGKEREKIIGWSEEAAEDGAEKPYVRPLDNVHSLVAQLEAQLNLEPHQQPAGMIKVTPMEQRGSKQAGKDEK